eukprot:COSAG02_NODE_166_length_31947_cov_34.168617_7_plen_94_part_00
MFNDASPSSLQGLVCNVVVVLNCEADCMSSAALILSAVSSTSTSSSVHISAREPLGFQRTGLGVGSCCSTRLYDSLDARLSLCMSKSPNNPHL